MLSLSLAVLGLAAYDACGQTPIAGPLWLTTVMHGLAGVSVSVAIWKGRLTPHLSSLLLAGSWLVLWLNTVGRISFAPASGQATLVVAVLAAAGWCVHSSRVYWLTMALAVPAALFPGLTMTSIDPRVNLVWTLPLGILFGWRILSYRVWTATHWDQLLRRNQEANGALQDTLTSLQANEERFRQLCENVPVGVFQTDENGAVIFTNTAWRRITGTAFRNTGHDDWTQSLHRDERHEVREAWHAAMRSGDNFERECRLVSGPGHERWIHFRSFANHSDSGTTYVGLAEEITFRKQAQDEAVRHAAFLQQAREKESQNAERLQRAVSELEDARQHAIEGTRAKSEFLANMSHEIRTPMTAVLGYADLLLEQTVGVPALQDPLRTIKRNGEFLLEIINDILDLSKIEAGKLEIEQVRCSPRQIVRDGIALMQIRARGKGLALNFENCGPFPQFVETDPTRFRQILLNLVSNAIKFTHSGSVTIGLSYQPPTHQNDDPVGQIHLTVRDTGMGMTADQQAKLFRPFTQADTSTTRQFGGTGLGLTICKRFAELMGGDILVDSVAGSGSTFTVVLPAHAATQVSNIGEVPVPPSAASAASALTVTAFPTTAGDVKLPYRLLVAEDGQDNQKLLQFILKKAGATVTLVENGQLAVDAVEAAVAEQQPYDLVLMDMSMPVLDGYCATQHLRERGHTLPIVALTAHAMSGDREKCLAAGCTDYATKPLNRAVLLETLQRNVQTTTRAAADTVTTR